MFKDFKELFETINTHGTSIENVCLLEEMSTTKKDEISIRNKVKRSLDVMRDSLEKGNELEIKLPITEATEQSQKMLSAPFFLSKDMKEAVYWAMSLNEYNCGMGLICALPTAGSCGVYPATIFKAKEMLKKTENDMIDATIVAGTVGAIIGNKASISGSESGCQAEIGVAASMATAAITYLSGGTPQQIGNAVAICLKNIMGLVCDPVAGLVISPCIKRNAMGVMNAFLSAEMALSGMTSIIPVDEVIEAMAEVGKKMSYELKETGLGGIATTPTGKKIKEQIFENIKNIR